MRIKIIQNILLYAMILSLIMAFVPSAPVYAAGVPTLTLLSPGSGLPGATLTGVIISGTNLEGATSVNFSGIGVTAGNIAVINSTRITATIAISGNAVPGFHDVTVTAGGVKSAPLVGGLTVASTGAAVVSLDAPAYVGPGGGFFVTINITGANQLNGYQLKLNFDPSAVQMAGLETNSHPSTGVIDGIINGVTLPNFGWTYQPNPGTVSGTVSLAGNLSNNKKVSGDGYLAKVYFKVVGAAGGQTNISLFAVDLADSQTHETFPSAPTPFSVIESNNSDLTTIVETVGATEVSDIRATLRGKLTSLGSASTVNLFMGYSLVKGGPYTLLNGPVATGSSILPLSFSTNVSGLTPNTQYYFTAFAQYGSQTVTGAEMTFTTGNPAGPAAKLAFTTQPGGAIAGLPFTTQPVVAIEDALGNVVSSDNTTLVALTTGSNAAHGFLSGMHGVQASGGFAVFSGLSIDTAGTYTLIATSIPPYTSATSNPFNVGYTPGVSTKLKFGQQPSGAVVGSPIAPPVTVEILDGAGNVVTSDNTTSVTLTISGINNETGALGGNTIVTAIDGVAVFDGLSVNAVGIYALTATSNPTYSPATSITFSISGPANKLVFTTQPGGALAGAPLNPQPVVAVEDAQGHVVISENGTTITLVLGNNPAGGTISGNLTVPVSGGYAAFSGLSIDTTGTYTLVATSSPAYTSATSNPFFIDFVIGVATKLKFGQEPTDTAVGYKITPAVTVQIQDGAGGIVTGDSSTRITLSIGNNPGNATMGGTTAITASNGLATFSDLTLNQAGTGYTLIATPNTAYTPATSSPFNVIMPTYKLVFTTQPGGALAGAPLNPQPVVAVEDAQGHVVISENGTTITLVLGNNPAGGTISGNLTVPVSGGYAAFSVLSIDTTGTYTLVATSSPAYTSATSNPFFIDFVIGVATKLKFGQEPTDTAVGYKITPAVTVQIQDGAGGIVTGDSSTRITLSIGNNPGNATMGGTTAITASNGLATFSDLTLNQAGTGYTLIATPNTAYTPATSSPFNVIMPTYKLVFTTQPGGALAGAPLNPQPVVAVEDAQGSNVVTSDNVTQVTLTPSIGTLSGINTMIVTAGVAAFSGLSFSAAGTYTLAAASSPIYTPATSNPFDITAANFGGGGGGGGGGGYSPPRPVVSSVTPGKDSTGVDINSAVKAVFSMAMIPGTITTTTFTLMNGTTTVVAGVTYDSSKYTATLTPTKALEYNTLYTATVTTGAQNTSGYGLISNYVWSFTTVEAPPPATIAELPPPPSIFAPPPAPPEITVPPATSPATMPPPPSKPAAAPSPLPESAVNWGLIIGLIIGALIIISLITIIVIRRRKNKNSV